MGFLNLPAVPNIIGRYVYIASIAAAFFVSCGSAEQTASSAQAAATSCSAGFVVFDGTMYRNKPDLSKHRIQSVNIIYGARFWDNKTRMEEVPSEHTVRRLAREAAERGDMTVIDIEHWLLNRSDAEVQESLLKYTTVAKWFRQEAPGTRIGYFGMFPLPDYDRARGALGYWRYRAWQQDNDRLKPLANVVDVIFPEAYTLQYDPAEWVKYATALITDARRYGKPVYVFLWPQYSEKNKLLAHQYLPTDFWQLQLDTAKRHADGVVIWGGWDGKNQQAAEWDETAPWWQVTKHFCKT